MTWTSTRVLLVALTLSIALFFHTHPLGSSPAADYDIDLGGELHPAVLYRDYAHEYWPRQDDPSDSSSTSPSRSNSQPSSTPTRSSSSTPTRSSSSTESTPSETPTETPPGESTTDPPKETPSSPISDGYLSTSTGEGGSVTVITIFTKTTTTSTSGRSTETAAPSGGIKTPTIIGLSVAGGIAVVAVVAFLVWKMSRKKFSDFDSDGEAIKWPELNNETHALPARPTGRAGIETSPTRQHSDLYSETASNSNSEMHPDPYAVPPLPHQNPNQPYRDDPYGGGGGGVPGPAGAPYYDPYRGPVPQTFQSPQAPGWGMQGGEAIPMSTYSARSHSPGPGYAYDQRTASPAPTVPQQGRQSPGPNLAYGGPPVAAARRPSPGPAQAYGGYGQGPAMQRGASPGPNMAYNPHAQEDAYGGIS
ncbi:hypothetical protein AURDEDRAFT_112729 [Auricularia subglabra TFB-10046 SS5]|nr:hypothetical protein AURDEDRAFT_112729 [Auricularia subglabra TFB-10046 SS5]